MCWKCDLDEWEAEYRLGVIERYTGAPPPPEVSQKELEFIAKWEAYQMEQLFI